MKKLIEPLTSSQKRLLKVLVPVSAVLMYVLFEYFIVGATREEFLTNLVGFVAAGILYIILSRQQKRVPSYNLSLYVRLWLAYLLECLPIVLLIGVPELLRGESPVILLSASGLVLLLSLICGVSDPFDLKKKWQERDELEPTATT